MSAPVLLAFVFLGKHWVPIFRGWVTPVPVGPLKKKTKLPSSAKLNQGPCDEQADIHHRGTNSVNVI